MNPPSTQIEAVPEIDVAGAVHTVQQDDIYGETWGQTEVPTAEPVGLERYMVEQDKLYVVVAVVLMIWIGIALFLFRTDRRIALLERRIDEDARSVDSVS